MGTERIRRVGSGQPVLASLLVVAVLVSACGGSSDTDVAATSSVEQATTVTGPAPTEAEEADLQPPTGDCPVDASSLGETLGVQLDEQEPLGAVCGFEGQRWSVWVFPLPDATDLARPGLGESLSGVGAPNRTTIALTRAGLWTATSGITVGGSSWLVDVNNGAQGADTYPAVDGPEQKPLTLNAMRDVLALIVAAADS